MAGTTARHFQRRAGIVRRAAISGTNTAFARRIWQWPVRVALGRIDNRRFGFRNGDGPTAHTFSGPTSSVWNGPYYIPGSPFRSNIQEDREGVVVELTLQVVDHRTSEPIAGALVELWQCDAEGRYSGYLDNDPNELPNIPRLLLERYAPSDDTRFLRGAQFTGADGSVRFTTIYPGPYTPRTRHMHAKVRREHEELLTTELFFPPDVDRSVLARPPYSGRRVDYSNQNDIEIFRAKGAPGSWVRMTETDTGYLADLALRVDRTPYRRPTQNEQPKTARRHRMR
jgi:protocatechuate 3,4-dioxygenase beta subunit